MIKSYLMIGQSNMAGRGFLSEVEPVADKRLLMLRNCRWRPFSEPVNFDRPTAGVGLVSGFAKSFVEANTEDTASFLVPTAERASTSGRREHLSMRTRFSLREWR